MRTVLLFGVAVVLAMVAGCKGTEKTEAVTADIEAAQMEGRRAARELTSRQWNDSVELQKALMQAKAKQSQYLINGEPECGAAFDSAFVQTIRTVRPDIRLD